MVLFTKQNPDGTIKPVWRGAKRKADDSGTNDPAFEFEHRVVRGRKRPFVMYMVQGLPDIAANDTNRDLRNTQLAKLALQEADATKGKTYSLRLEHCKAIVAPAQPGRDSGFLPAAVDQVYLNEAGGSLISWMLTMFEDQAQMLEAMTTNMPAASWASIGPAGSILTGRPLDLHDDIWNAASRWMDLRIRNLTTATRPHLYTALNVPDDGNFNATNNDVVEMRGRVNFAEKLDMNPGIASERDTAVDFRVSQMNNLVHGGDLELDYTLLRSWVELLVPDRAIYARRLYYVECFREYYGGITYMAAEMIIQGAKKRAPLQYYFLNHRHFINKFLAVRSPALASLYLLPKDDRSPVETRLWEDCRLLFHRYIEALNHLAHDPEAQQRMNQAELRAYALYERIAPYPRWINNSIPTRALFWKPAEHMAWDWPGLNQGTPPLTLSSPSTTWMPVPTGPGFAPAPVRRNVLPNAGWPSWEWPPRTTAQAPAA